VTDASTTPSTTPPASPSIELAEFDQDTPTARGEAHGELWRAQIHELAAIRSALAVARGSFRDLAELEAVAALHLPLLERFSGPLYSELLGIARGAGITPTQAVILNHYTDLRDVPPAVLSEPTSDDPGGCTAVYVPGDTGGPVLGQTWDMHGTARPFVRMIRIRPRGSDEETLCFTLTGCLGMTGLSADGVGVTINNLSSTDGQVGVVWPALVRAMLASGSAAQAHALLERTRLSSGHHYMMADGRAFFGVETSGQLKVLTQTGARAAHLHTNHCFDPVLRKRERVPRVSTTFRRLELASTLYVQQRPQTAEQLWAFLGSHEGYPRSLCSHVDDASGDPSASRTCGMMVMRLVGGEVLAGGGCGQESPPERFTVTRWRGLTESA
jgi:isopenicillin-N N-acyltransferase-like protein